MNNEKIKLRPNDIVSFMVNENNKLVKYVTLEKDKNIFLKRKSYWNSLILFKNILDILTYTQN